VDRYANVFLHPVTEDIAPGYRSVVFRYVPSLVDDCLFNHHSEWSVRAK